MQTAEISHHPASVVDGSGRPRAAEWRLFVPGYPTMHFPHDGTDAGRREAHGRALDALTDIFAEQVAT